jgi:hypothetical protein
MIRNAAFAALIAFGAAGAAQAQDHGPHLIGGGENAQVVYREQSNNVVGGGVASIDGGANNLRITYGPGVVSEAPNGTVARLTGGGDNEQVVHEQAAPTAALLAARTVQARG